MYVIFSSIVGSTSVGKKKQTFFGGFQGAFGHNLAKRMLQSHLSRIVFDAAKRALAHAGQKHGPVWGFRSTWQRGAGSRSN